MLDQVESLLKENRRQVLALAHALETHRTLTGEDVEAVLEGRQGLAVDGRPYSDPSFAKSLEEYHRAAAEAHTGHGRVLLDLPEAPKPVAADQDGEGRMEGTPDFLEPSHGELGRLGND
jgi:hypothetical protein